MFLVTGALAYDYILAFPGKFSDHILPEKIHVINISCVVDKVDRHFGGTGGNQAYTLGLLGMKPIMLGAAGKDFGPYDEYLRSVGVDTQWVSYADDYLTTMGYALFDKSNNQIWGFAKNAMKKAKDLRIAMVKPQVSFVLITPDDYDAISQYIVECNKLKIPYAFDPAFDIPQLTVEILTQGVQGAEVVFGNDYEIAQLMDRCSLTHEVLVKDKIVITTLGEKGSVVEYNEQKYEIPVATPKKLVNPSGAGDAYRSGFLAGYKRGFELPVCGRMGAVAASYAIENNGTIEHTFTLKEFSDRYKENFGKQLEL